MADIELVIKIPEGLKNEFESEQWTALSCMEMKEALIHSKPLPKGHGALKDADKLAVAIAMRRDNWNYYGNEYESTKFETYDICVDEIIDAPTIIEAEENKDNPN